jgi:hypothetical protein
MWFRRKRNPAIGRPLALDPGADSASGDLPAFLARPEDAPVYHGFPILDVEVEGFRLGMITDFLAAPDVEGDAFVVAPDGSRAGLVWTAEAEEYYFGEILGFTHDRWGVWGVEQTLPMRDLAEAREYLAAIVPELQTRWEAWRTQFR